MLNLEPKKMKAAIERAKAEHLKVRAISVTDRTYAVTSKQGTVYTVRFVVVNGHKLAECSCPATTYCKHMAAAAQVNIMCQSMRATTPTVAESLAFISRNQGWMV